MADAGDARSVTGDAPGIDPPRLRRWLGHWLGRLRLPPDLRGPVIAACSGGADSLALLALARASGLEVVAVHVDHGLRPDSHLDAGTVRGAAARLGVPWRSVAAPVETGPGLEERARRARYEALERERAAASAEAVLVGHTRDDQAETVLLNLLRGAGLTGLGGMPWRRGFVVRPLLDLARADTVEVCARLGLHPLDDPMNADPAFRRVWLRREVIPFLEAGGRRDLRALLARQAEVARAESDFLDQQARLALEEMGSAPSAERVPVTVADLPPALARRAVRLWLGPPPPSLSDVERVLSVARGEQRAAELSGGRRIERSRGSLWRASGRPAFPFPVELPVPGRASGGGWTVEAWVERAPPLRWPDGRFTAVLDADAVGDVLTLRAPRPGERFAPLGMEGSKALTAALAEVGVPRSRRSAHPVVAEAAGTPVWVVGYRVSHRARVTAATRRYLWLTASTSGETAA